MSSNLKENLVGFAKRKKGSNVRFKGDRVYTKGHARGNGECQDLVDLGLKTIGGKMGARSAAPRKGMLVTFANHTTRITVTIFATKGGVKQDTIQIKGATMSRAKHIAVIDSVLLDGKKLWVWEQNVTPDKRTVRGPVRNDKKYVAAKKSFKSTDSVWDAKKFLEWKLDYHATVRSRPGLKKFDWNLVKDWMKSGYGIFIQIDLKSSGTIKFYDLDEDKRPE